MPKPGSLLGDIGNEFKSLGKDVARSVISEPKDLAKKAAQQIGLEHEPGVKESSTETNPGVAEQANKDLLEAMYGSSQKNPEEQVGQVENSGGQQAGENPQKAQKHQQTHTETYYQPLVQKVEEEQKTPADMETKAEKMERLGMEDLQQRQKDEEKKKPISVSRAETATEAKVGSG